MKRRRLALYCLAGLIFWGAISLWLVPQRWRVPRTTRVTGGRDA